MGFFEDEKEMVANAYHNYVATFGNAHNIYGRKRGRAVHLHVVLKV